MTTEKLVVASRTKRFWAFSIDQTIITLVVTAIFLAVLATQVQQMTNAFNTFFSDPLWAQMEQLPSDVFQTRLEALMSSEKVVTAVKALAHPFALAVFLSLVFEAAYYIVPTAKWGVTLGKKWLRIAVYDFESRTMPDWLQSSIRYFAFLGLGTFSGIVSLLDLLVNKSFLPSNVAVDILGNILSQITWIATVTAIVLIVARPDRRGLHDILAKTIVYDTAKSDI